MAGSDAAAHKRTMGPVDCSVKSVFWINLIGCADEVVNSLLRCSKIDLRSAGIARRPMWRRRHKAISTHRCTIFAQDPRQTSDPPGYTGNGQRSDRGGREGATLAEELRSLRCCVGWRTDGGGASGYVERWDSWLLLPTHG